MDPLGMDHGSWIPSHPILLDCNTVAMAHGILGHRSMEPRTDTQSGFLHQARLWTRNYRQAHVLLCKCLPSLMNMERTPNSSYCFASATT